MTHRAKGVIEELEPATGTPLASRRSSVSGLSLARLQAWADGERARGHLVATWNDPTDGLAFGFSGIAAETQATSLQALESACSGLVEQQVREAPEGEPCVYIGSRFDPARPAGDVWSGWPVAWAVVPERALIIHAGPLARAIAPASGASATAIVRGRDEAALDQALEELVRDVERATPRAPERIPAARSTPLEAREAFEARVVAATAAIRQGALEKVVLARAVRHQLPRGHTWDVAAALDRLPLREGTIALSVSRPGAGALVAATPELLVRVRGRRVEAPALAGTTRRGASLAEDEALAAALLAETKARHEHALVAEAVRAALRPALRAPGRPGRPHRPPPGPPPAPRDPPARAAPRAGRRAGARGGPAPDAGPGRSAARRGPGLAAGERAARARRLRRADRLAGRPGRRRDRRRDPLRAAARGARLELRRRRGRPRLRAARRVGRDGAQARDDPARARVSP